MSSLAPAGEEAPLLDPDRFLPEDHRFPGGWALAPTTWPLPEEGLLAAETKEVIVEAIRGLPPAQRAVITLRDIAGWPPDEVCDALDAADGNQRVLLHRAHQGPALEEYFGAVEPNPAAALSGRLEPGDSR